jgi:hypothetical protein
VIEQPDAVDPSPESRVEGPTLDSSANPGGGGGPGQRTGGQAEGGQGAGKASQGQGAGKGSQGGASKRGQGQGAGKASQGGAGKRGQGQGGAKGRGGAKGQGGGKGQGGAKGRGGGGKGQGAGKGQGGAKGGQGAGKGQGGGKRSSGAAGGHKPAGKQTTGGGKGARGGAPDRHESSAETVARLAGPLQKVLRRLPETQRRVLELRMGLADGHPHDLADTARELGLSLGEAREIEQRAFEHIREAIPLQQLQRFLPR